MGRFLTAMRGFARNRARRWHVRLVVPALVVVLAYAAVVLVPAWFDVYFPPRRLRHIAVGFLAGVRIAYGMLLLFAPPVCAASAVFWWSARRRFQPSVWATRALTLSLALLAGAALAELGAMAWFRATRVRMPRLPTRFTDSGDDRTIDLLVIGESSAHGTPYSQRLSVGEIVAWRLRDALHGRPVRTDVQATPGFTLGHMQQRLGGTLRRPELAIIYAGHNEFQSMFNWSQSPFYYADEIPAGRITIAGLGKRISPVLGTIEKTLEELRRSVPPPRIVTRELVDVPVYTTVEYARRLHEFRTRLEVTVAYLERLGALVVLIIPPGNDAGFEPNRSVLPPETPRAEREAFARGFQAACALETRDSDRAMAAYRSLVDRQPGFAESHFRLARLLERAGDRVGAARHYARARDLDGFPMRCVSEFQEAYRAVSARHPKAILVDGLAALRGRSPTGLLDDDFFNDGFHPSLNGHAALAEEVLLRLYDRHAFGWPGDAGPPRVSPADCASHFGVDRATWRDVCDFSARFYQLTAFIRHDPAERSAKAERYAEAGRKVFAGEPFSAVSVPGIGPALEDSGRAGMTVESSGPRLAGCYDRRHASPPAVAIVGVVKINRKEVTYASPWRSWPGMLGSGCACARARDVLPGR